jgi:hypothetical protein
MADVSLLGDRSVAIGVPVKVQNTDWAYLLLPQISKTEPHRWKNKPLGF